MNSDLGSLVFPLALAGVVALSTALAATTFGQEPPASSRPVRVVVWDEQQPEQKTAYPNFLGNAIADHLKSRPGFSVRSVRLDDPGQGLTDEVLNDCDVLVWWGHRRHNEVAPEVGRRVVERIKAGKLSLVALHSAHWSSPFVQAMYERTRQEALKSVPENERR